MRRKIFDKVSGYWRYDVETKFLYEEKYASKEIKKYVKWAHEKGFTYNRAVTYGLTEENYHKYISDIDYYSLHPLNEFSHWIDDKLTLRLTLDPFREFLPEYYFHIKADKTILPCLDYKGMEKEKYSACDIVALLENKEKLIIKPLFGTCSIGVYLFEYKNDSFFINGELNSREQVICLMEEFEDYLVEEAIQFSDELPKQSDSMRIVVFNPNGANPEIVCTYLWDNRLGDFENYENGYLFNCDVNDGSFKYIKKISIYRGIEGAKGQIFINDENTNKEYPLEGEDLKYKGVPHWTHIRENVLRICKSLPQLSYMGFDVIVTKDSFKILEINSHQDILWQSFVPAMEPETTPYKYFRNRL